MDHQRRLSPRRRHPEQSARLCLRIVGRDRAQPYQSANQGGLGKEEGGRCGAGKTERQTLPTQQSISSIKRKNVFVKPDEQS